MRFVCRVWEGQPAVHIRCSREAPSFEVGSATHRLDRFGIGLAIRGISRLCAPWHPVRQTHTVRAPEVTVRGHRRDTTRPCLA